MTVANWFICLVPRNSFVSEFIINYIWIWKRANLVIKHVCFVLLMSSLLPRLESTVKNLCVWMSAASFIRFCIYTQSFITHSLSFWAIHYCHKLVLASCNPSLLYIFYNFLILQNGANIVPPNIQISLCYQLITTMKYDMRHCFLVKSHAALDLNEN